MTVALCVCSCSVNQQRLTTVRGGVETIRLYVFHKATKGSLLVHKPEVSLHNHTTSQVASHLLGNCAAWQSQFLQCRHRTPSPHGVLPFLAIFISPLSLGPMRGPLLSAGKVAGVTLLFRGEGQCVYVFPFPVDAFKS